MKKIILGIFVALLFVNIVFAQDTEPKLTKAEILEAQLLAAKFYNRLAQTQDVAPLIREFFIRDFGRWYKNVLTQDSDPEIPKTATEKEVEQYYVTFINYFYLYFNSVNFVQIMNPKLNPKGIIDIVGAREIVNKEIEKQLKKTGLQYDTNNFDPRSYSFGFSKTGNSFEKVIEKTNQFISILKKVEAKFRLETKKKLPKTRLYFLPKDFEAQADYGEFMFPKRTKLIMVWNKNLDSTHIPCVITVIKIKGKLKVLITTPPTQ